MIKSKVIYFIIVVVFACVYQACNTDEKVIPPSEIYINMPDDGYQVDFGDTLLISPKITYDYDSEYEWTENGVVFSTDKDLQYIANELEQHDYVFSVVNDRGSDTLNVNIQSFYRTDFEELELDADTFWAAPNGETYFSSGLLDFSNDAPPSRTEYWNGFTYANMTGSQSDDNLTEMFSAYTSSSDFDSEVYCILRQDSLLTPSTITPNDGKLHKFHSLEFNISYASYDAIRFGTDSTEAFGINSSPDWATLTITGYDSLGSATSSVSTFIADYRYDNNINDYIVTEWTQIPLETLGLVSKLEFTITSSDTDATTGVMHTPISIVIDEILIEE